MADLMRERIGEAYLRPIRMVLAVDDEFHHYDKPPEKGPQPGKDPQRAYALWQACRKRGLLCDIDDGSGLVSGQNPPHLLNSDLVILDYHLQGEDPRWALDLLSSLAASEHASLVVVYTQDPDLLKVRRRIAAHLRGAFAPEGWLTKPEEKQAWEAFESKIKSKPTETLVERFIAGDPTCRGDATLRKELETVGVPKPSIAAIIGVLLEFAVKELTSRPGNPNEPPPVLGPHGASPWVYANNLFVVCVKKTKENLNDGDLVFAELEKALCEWNPNFLLCAVAYARGEFARGGFKHERESLNDPLLQAGWLYHAWAGSEDERAERLRVLFERVITSYATRVLDTVISFGSKHVPPHENPGPTSETLQAVVMVVLGKEGQLDPNLAMRVLHTLNEFLVIEEPSGYVQTGTIFLRDDNAEPAQAYVCVTAACDLVPRIPREGSWEHQLHPIRAVTALRARMTDIDQKSLSEAEQGRHIFLNVNGMPKTLVLIEEKPPVPALEWFLLEDMGRIEDGKVRATRFVQEQVAGKNTLITENVIMRVLGQIRALYASRIQQYGGQHISRIGVDFVNLPPVPPKGSAKGTTKTV